MYTLKAFSVRQCVHVGGGQLVPCIESRGGGEAISWIECQGGIRRRLGHSAMVSDSCPLSSLLQYFGSEE